MSDFLLLSLYNIGLNLIFFPFQHRNQIMNGRFDYQEIAMFFDKMVRKHDVSKTLALARKLFAEYLNEDWATTAKTAVNSADETEQQCKPSC